MQRLLLHASWPEALDQDAPAIPAIEAAREKMRAAAQLENLGASLPWPSKELWRQTVQTYGERLYGDDVDAAREALRMSLGLSNAGPQTMV